MPVYSAERAQERLKGGTRLHRAILRKETEAVAAWLAHGADRWAPSGPLAQTLLANWKPIDGEKPPVQMSAVALAVLTCATPADLVGVKALLTGVDFQATPERVEEVFHAYVNNPRRSRVPNLWTSLLDRGFTLPSRKGTARWKSVWYDAHHLERLSTAEEAALVAHRGWPALHAHFTGLGSPLDKAFDRPNGMYPQRVIRWLATGMPLADPQVALIQWPLWFASFAAPTEAEATWETGLTLLLERGARLDSTVGPAGCEWDMVTRALCVSTDLAAALQARQGLTLHSPTASGYTPAANLLRQSINGDRFSYLEALASRVAQGLPLDEAADTARGLRSILQELPIRGAMVQGTGTQPLWADQTRRWREWAIAQALPDAGMEAGQPLSAFDTWWATVLKLHRGNEFGKRLTNGHTLWTELTAWAQYAQRPLAEHAQAWLVDVLTGPADARVEEDVRSVVGAHLIAAGATPFVPAPVSSAPAGVLELLWDQQPTAVRAAWLNAQWKAGAFPFQGLDLPPATPDRPYGEPWWKDVFRQPPSPAWTQPFVLAPGREATVLSLALDTTPQAAPELLDRLTAALPQTSVAVAQGLLAIIERLGQEHHGVTALPAWVPFIAAVTQHAIQSQAPSAPSEVAHRRPGLRRS
jgi:hypothetical protein